MNAKNHDARTITEDGRLMLKKAEKDGLETVWDRYEAQLPQCGFCELGLSCRNCVMGPCRIDPFGEGPQKGVCGADADIIVARNLGRMIAAGAAAHSDHGRDLLEILRAVGEGNAPGYRITSEEKLFSLAKELGIDVESASVEEVAVKVANYLEEDFGTRKKSVSFVSRVPPKRLEVWKRLGIVPRGIDREVVEMMHRTHMGVDNDWVNLLLHGLRTALADGWGGSMIATEVSDILFGVPKPVESKINLGVLKESHVNIVLHGHNPLVSEMIVQAANDESIVQLAKDKGAEGINLVGLCCTGNEVLMRRGIPMAGNHLMSELVIATGAVEMMIVDYQCIMPSLGDIAKCYHTKMISTSDKAKFPHMEHKEFHPDNAKKLAYDIVKEAVENFSNRIKERVYIPVEPVSLMSGFSVEALLEAMGGTLTPLIEAIKSGLIKGAVGVVGCNNPKIKHDFGHVTLTTKLIQNDILVVDTGCAAVAHGKAGLKQLDALSKAGPGLREVCKSLSIPPVLHVGSCVDNIRILILAAALANELGTDISDLPLAAAAPEWYSEKAVSIACYAVGSGIFTVLGVTPPVMGSKNIVSMLTEGLQDVIGAVFAVQPDPEIAADLIISHIEKQRNKLGIG